MDKQLSYCNVWLPLLEFYSGHLYNNDKKQTDSFMIQKKKKARRDILKSRKTEQRRPGCCYFSKPLVQQEKSREQTEAIFSRYILTSCHNEQCNYPLKSRTREKLNTRVFNLQIVLVLSVCLVRANHSVLCQFFSASFVVLPCPTPSFTSSLLQHQIRV